MVLTFDKLLYPVTMGTCKHVLMTTYPQRDPDTRRNITHTKVLALIDEDTIGTKTIFLLVNDHDVRLKKVGDDLKVEVDEIPIQLSRSKSYELRDEGNEIIFEIDELPDGSVEVMSGKSDVKIVFDGERVQILVSKNVKQTGNNKSIAEI